MESTTFSNVFDSASFAIFTASECAVDCLCSLTFLRSEVNCASRVDPYCEMEHCAHAADIETLGGLCTTLQEKK
jgi:hypothetical protein